MKKAVDSKRRICMIKMQKILKKCIKMKREKIGRERRGLGVCEEIFYEVHWIGAFSLLTLFPHSQKARTHLKAPFHTLLSFSFSFYLYSSSHWTISTNTWCMLLSYAIRSVVWRGMEDSNFFIKFLLYELISNKNFPVPCLKKKNKY